MARSDCRVEGCARTVNAKGLCRAHRRRERLYGDPDVRLREWQTLVIPDREGCIFAAALLEGEGWFNAREFGIQMCDEDVLQRLAGLFGLNITGPYFRANKKPFWNIKVGRFEQKQALAAAIWPWMGQRRRAQIAQALRG